MVSDCCGRYFYTFSKKKRLTVLVYSVKIGAIYLHESFHSIS